ncbi:hypothetical protein [Sinomicrobium sp. M5D2P17]
MKILKSILFGGLFFSTLTLMAQDIKFCGYNLECINVKVSVETLHKDTVLKVERDLDKLPFDPLDLSATVDEPTFLKLAGENLENGTIEVKVLSQIQDPSPFLGARGFIGLAFRINNSNSEFESVYLRPANGRADNQFKRNHTVQYFSYPDYKFDRLRTESAGLYETYADISLDEWIHLKLEIQEKKAVLYINNQIYPSFIVTQMKGKNKSGGIGLFVDIGTIGYFKDLKISNN